DDMDPFTVSPVGPLLDGLSEVVLDEPGQPIERDGAALTRHEVTLRGAEAVEAAQALLLGSSTLDASTDAEDSLGEPDPFFEQLEAIDRYIEEHTTLDVVADLDEGGSMVRAEMELSVDLEEFPDCEPLLFTDSDVRIVLEDLGEPQVIEAPPSELVDESSAPGIEGMFGPDAFGEAPEGRGEWPSDGEVDAAPESLPEDFQKNPVLQTAAGPRDRYRVLNELVEWAEERDIAWEEVPPLESQQLVELYDAFFEQELQTRGPALETSDGLHSHQDVVDAVQAHAGLLGMEPASVAQLDDEALVEQFEVLLTEGVVPEPGFFGSVATGGDPLPDGDALMESYVDSMESFYEGCPT
ncbi:MAG: hypothetical protein R2716_14095, partial [Microthrixaceae bacterium]